jgi:hypothetical protein
MSQQFYNLQKTAEVLGIATADVNQLREQRKLHGYRSGADWKFKVEDVENLLAERIKAKGAAGKAPAQEGMEGDVLADDVRSGESDSEASGTVIGRTDAPPDDAAASDIQLTDSEAAPDAAASDVQLRDADDDSEFDLDLTIDEDIVMEDSQFSLAGEESGTDRASSASEVDLASEGEVLDDDDLVLGGATGSGSGSDITIAGDSGISLVDPNDSGLSLEEPVNLSGDSESLELGEDDMLTLPEESGEELEELPGDDDFLLTPMEDAGDEDDESGSQVIALDTEEGDEGATVLGAGGGMAAMLDEEVTVEEPLGAALVEVPDMVAVGAGPSMAAGPAVAGRSEAFLPEAPYGALWTTMLTLCVCCLGLCGILSYDIMRNIWSWSAEYTVNSTIMDTILSFIQ